MSRRLLRVLSVAACMAATGCGAGMGQEPPRKATPVAHHASYAAAFPHAAGRSLGAVLAALPEGPVLLPSVTVLSPGRNRIAFALYDTAGKQISGAPVALYVSYTGGTTARGPFRARSETLAVKPAFRSAPDGDDARALYVTEVPLAAAGAIAIVAVVKLDGRLVASRAHTLRVDPADQQPPAVGEPAPLIHTLVRPVVAGNAGRDARNPQLALLQTVDAATVLGHKPTVLVFSTNTGCTSHVCAPVLDVAAQVHAEAGKTVAVIHQDMRTGGAADLGTPPQVLAYRLRSEPWTFVVDRAGRISARFEGPLSVGELRRAVARVIRVRN